MPPRLKFPTLRLGWLIALAILVSLPLWLSGGSVPAEARLGLVVSQDSQASRIGFQVIQDGGNAIDAAVATAFALAVTHPAAGNIGGGGFIVYRPAAGGPVAYDFREMAPAVVNQTAGLLEAGVDRRAPGSGAAGR